MSDSYVQVYLQIVFSTKNRSRFFDQEKADMLGKIMFRIIKENGHTPLAIKCLPDHAHLFIRLSKTQPIGKLVGAVKANSSRWVNEQNWTKYKFQWQAGYSAFSYSQSHVSKVIEYIGRQEEHHKKKSFREELSHILKRRQIDYDPKYLFDN